MKLNIFLRFLQISEGANGVSPVHNKESFRVTVDNEESKQRSKKRNAAILGTTVDERKFNRITAADY